MNEEKKIRDTLIQIKTFKETKKQLEAIKYTEEKSFTDLLEEWINIFYNLMILSMDANVSFQKGKIRDLLEKYFDVKEMARGLLITEKTK